MKHSHIFGGSTAKQAEKCVGSICIAQHMPQEERSSEYANEGSMLHEAIAEVIGDNKDPNAMLGFKSHGITLTEELMEEKFWPYINAFDEYLAKTEEELDDTATIMVEQEVSFGKYMPDVFGSCDVLVRVGDRVIVLDWKFGHGEVDPKENAQLMFYAAAAARTGHTTGLFENASEVDLVIVQGGEAKVWGTTFPQISAFERKLKKAYQRYLKWKPKVDKVVETHKGDWFDRLPEGLPLAEGGHCRWCKAKPLCPLMRGAVDRALKADLQTIDPAKLGLAVEQSYLLEQWIKDLRQLAETSLENGIAVPGLKLVAKRGRREWAKAEEEILGAINDDALQPEELFRHELLSPAQMEKVLKKHGMDIPEDLVATVSSGHTMVLESDPRPALGGIIDLATKLKRLQ